MNCIFLLIKCLLTSRCVKKAIVQFISIMYGLSRKAYNWHPLLKCKLNVFIKYVCKICSTPKRSLTTSYLLELAYTKNIC